MKNKPTNKPADFCATDLLLFVMNWQSNPSVKVDMEVNLPMEHWLKLMERSDIAAGESRGMMPNEILTRLVENAVRKHLYPNEEVEPLRPGA